MSTGGYGFRRSLVLALALSFAYAPTASAQEDDPAQPVEGVNSATDTAPAPAEGDSADAGSGESQAPTDKTTSGSSASGTSKTTKGSGYGGRSTGPSPLVLLPADPAYPMPQPPASETLPEEIDAVAPWQPNIVCDPVDKPGVEAFGNLVGSNYGREDFSTSRTCTGSKSEHYDGRALDWPLNASDPRDRRIGDGAVTWLTDNDGEMAKRFGIQSIIWNSHSWKPDGKGWQGYVGESAHTDHVHFSFSWDGAMMRTSWWTSVALEANDEGPCAVVAGQYAAIPNAARTEPCPTGLIAPPDTGYTSVRPGGQGAGVGLLQPLLEVKQSGELDGPTREALLGWQDEQGVPQTGVLDQLTYAAALGWNLPAIPDAARALALPDYLVTDYSAYQRVVLSRGSIGPAVEALQNALELDADGSFGPITEEALLKFTTDNPRLAPQEETSALVWHELELRDNPTLPYRSAALAQGDTGAAVVMAQQLVGAEPDGVFGPMTEAAILRAQSKAGLDETGVMDGLTWAALDVGEKTANS